MIADKPPLSRLLLVIQLRLATRDLRASVWIYWSRLPIRLIKSISSHLNSELSISLIQVGFNYNIELVDDNNYGALNLTTGEWNGLVKVNIIFLKLSKNVKMIILVRSSWSTRQTLLLAP